MKVFELSRFHKIRIWDSVSPLDQRTDSQIDEAVFPAPAPGPATPRCFTIESRRIVGPMALYGLLGGTCQHQSSSQRLSIRVHVNQNTPDDDDRLPWALGSESDSVFSGISSEFSKAIMESGNSVAAARLGGCCVDFRWGAFAEMGSSDDVFKGLSRTLVLLFAQQAWPLDDEILLALISGGGEAS